MSAREPIDPTRHFRFTPDSGWEDVQVQYRLLVQRWHPDRHPPETRAEAQAEFIEIVAAFKGLRRHYGVHGRLPPIDPPRVEGPPMATVRAPRVGGPRPPAPGAMRVRAILRSPLTAALAALCLALALAALVLLLDERLEGQRLEQALSRAAESGERTLRRE